MPMAKKNLGVVFGGMSTESKVSESSAKSILANLDKEKYNIYPIFISKDGNWWKYEKEEKNEKIENIVEYLKQMDVVFPVLHGLYGEDGTIQGLLELLKIPYVGCGILASSVGMDKVYTKIIFEKAGLKQAKYEYIRKYKDKYIYVDKQFNEKTFSLQEIAEKIIKNLGLPVFVKPSRSGSSVGINKACTQEELEKNIEEASQFDNKIIIEEQIDAREIECAVLGNEEIQASVLGEVKSAESFYSYSAKYQNKQSFTEIPADLPQEISEEIRKLAVKAFKAIDGKGLSRVDFFVDKNTSEIYINEINTLPGFTEISMYPQLFEASGINYKDLLDEIIAIGDGPFWQ